MCLNINEKTAQYSLEFSFHTMMSVYYVLEIMLKDSKEAEHVNNMCGSWLIWVEHV